MDPIICCSTSENQPASTVTVSSLADTTSRSGDQSVGASGSQPARSEPAAEPAAAQPAAAGPEVRSRRTADTRGQNRKLLMITSMAGSVNCAASLGAQLRMAVDVVATRREGLAALRCHDYTAVIVDDAIAESDPQGAELLRKHAGAAIVLEVNFAISGVARLARLVPAELHRREQEHGIAMRLATATIERELKGTVAGLLLHSQLALNEPNVSPQLSTKLHQLVQLAGNLRQQLERPQSMERAGVWQ